ncbi:MAG TPA: hypothetical protein VI750_09275, partial [Pyrinomonadaceae bacterium]|nr:hypothetical protein [Pyrinomonadaceae bacterium]
LRPASLDWALDHALNFGDTTMLPLPFEYEAIQYDWAEVRKVLEKEDILKWTVRPHRTMLSPKAKYGFRIITQLDPLDFLIYAALVKEIGAHIENARVDRSVVFSYRFSPGTEGRLFDPSFGTQTTTGFSRTAIHRPIGILRFSLIQLSHLLSSI